MRISSYVGTMPSVGALQFPRRLNYPRTGADGRVTNSVLSMVIRVPFTNERGFPVRPRRVPGKTGRLRVRVIVGVFRLVTTTFRFFRIKDHRARRVKRLVRKFLTLIWNKFRLVRTIWDIRRIYANFAIVLPYIIIRVFRLFFLIPRH